MAKFAEISGTKVTNIVVGDSAEELKALFNRDFVEYTDENPAGFGWDYNPKTGKFSNPDAVGE